MYGTGFFPTERGQHLRGRARRALPDRHLGGRRSRRSTWARSSTSCHCATRATRPTSGASPARPGKDTRGMFRVHQFDKVEMFVFTRARALDARSTTRCSRSRSRSSRSSASPTASSTSRPATSAPPRPRSTTSRPGSRASSATARSRRPRTRPTTRPGASASASGASGKLEPVHTLNGTAMTARWLIAAARELPGRRRRDRRPRGPDAASARPPDWPRLASQAGCQSGRMGRS